MSTRPKFLRIAVVLLLSLGCERGPDSGPANVTFSRDVAPILFQNCSPCHRPGESGPFNLLSYADAKKRARQIADVTADRYMPPWKPAPGYGEFLGRASVDGRSDPTPEALGRSECSGGKSGKSSADADLE